MSERWPKRGEAWESNGTSGEYRVVLVLKEHHAWDDDFVTVAYIHHTNDEHVGKVYCYPVTHVLKRFRRLP